MAFLASGRFRLIGNPISFFAKCVVHNLQPGSNSLCRHKFYGDITPRQIFLNYPLGNPAGRPHDPDNQRAVLRAGLELLKAADKPGIIVDLPYVWSDSTAWIKDFMTDKQPFISEAAETKRQETLQQARQKKTN